MDLSQSRLGKETMAFNQLGQAMTSTLELREVLEMVLGHLSDIFGAQSAWVLLYKPEKDHLEMVALKGWGDKELEMAKITLKPGEGVSGEVFNSRVPIYVPDVQGDLRFIYKGAAERGGIRSMIGVPLIVKGKAIGMIGLYAPSMLHANKIEQDRMDLLLTFASQAAIAIENARLYQDLAEKVKELKNLQRQLVQTEKLSAIGELVSGVAHELNNPLTSVIGYTQLILENEEDPQKKEYLTKIFEEAKSCSEIIRNLLTFARYHKPQRIFSDVNTGIERALDLKTYQIETDGIQIVQALSPNLPPFLMDSHQMQQVFFNIINNAHQALADRGGSSLPPILTVRSQGRGPWIVVSFEDSGPGIPPEILPKIFEPFYTTKEVGVGTGLGLSISYGIVKEHGGEIRVETEVGKGSTFSVWLPLVAYDEMGRPIAFQGNLNGKEILIVDSSEVILEMCAYVLRSQGVEVHLAKNGEMALKQIRKHQLFNLVFVAIPLSDMDLSSFYGMLCREFPQYSGRLLFSVPEGLVNQEPDGSIIFQRAGCIPLDRPFSITEFKQAVEAALTSSRTCS